MPKTPRSDESGPFIVWLDYHTEGWEPRSFDLLEDALVWLQTNSHAPFVLTERLLLRAERLASS